MKKVYILLLSTVLCTTSPVFAMDSSQTNWVQEEIGVDRVKGRRPSELIAALQKYPADSTEICLGRATCNDDVLKNLASFTNLVYLNLSADCWRESEDYYHITNDGLAHLKGLTKLQTLVLDNNEWITDRGLGHLNSLKNLETLRLGSDRAYRIKSGCQYALKIYPPL
jgi:hypothetical protein